MMFLAPQGDESYITNMIQGIGSQNQRIITKSGHFP